LNNRDHRKICVIDGHTGFTGGINLADEYINEEIRFGKWKDNAILLRGEAVYGLTSLFLATWGHVSHEPITDFKPYLPSVYASEMEASPKGEGYIAPYGYHPLTSEPACHEVYVSLIAKATRSIDIMTPYFIPDEELEQALIRAAKSGVRVRLITPHIPDKPTIFDVTRSFYQNLVEAGAEVYEYTPGFVHAKVMVIDDDMATVGTVNFDFRSLYLHMENGCFLYHNPVVSDVKRDVEETLKECKQITLEMVESTPVSKRLYRAILRLISTAL
ncbi:MAG: cardiolipin synthase, partial [Bacilli bacterium]|nr:cardiolipin synthase [Bacilli bacterium]